MQNQFWMGLLLGILAWSGAQAAPPSRTLKVMSYNLQGVPDPRLDHSRYADIGRELKRRRDQGNAPHVVVLQEAFTLVSLEAGRLSEYPYQAKGPSFGMLQVGSGLVVLSEYPIIEVNSFVYSNCTGIDCFSRKAVFQTLIAVPWMREPLEIYTTHMNATPDGEDPGADRWVQVRKAQADQHLRFLQKNSRSDRVAILGGDYNFSPGFSDYEFFADRLSTQLNIENTGFMCAKLDTCVGSENPARDTEYAIDHQFYRSSSQMKVYPIYYGWKFTEPVRGRKLSDHDALEVVYRFVERD